MSADCKFRPKSCFSSQQGHFADFFGDKAAPVVVHGAISLNFSESNKGEQILRKSRDRGERQVHLLIFHYFTVFVHLISATYLQRRESNVDMSTSSSLANRVWDLDGNENVTLRLRSPGISVCWHPEEALKVTSV